MKCNPNHEKIESKNHLFVNIDFFHILASILGGSGPPSWHQIWPHGLRKLLGSSIFRLYKISLPILKRFGTILVRFWMDFGRPGVPRGWILEGFLARLLQGLAWILLRYVDVWKNPKIKVESRNSVPCWTPLGMLAIFCLRVNPYSFFERGNLACSAQPGSPNLSNLLPCSLLHPSLQQ